MVQVEVMPDFMGQCAAAGRIWKTSGRCRSNGTDLIVPKDHSIIGGRLTAHTGAAVGKTCWTIGIAQNGARWRVLGFHFTNHPDVQVFVVVPGRAALAIAVSLDRIAAVPWVCAQGGLLPDDPAVAVSIRVFVGQPKLDLRISGHSLKHRPGLGGIGIQPSVILVQDTKAIEDLLTTDIVFLIRPKNMEHNRDVVENGPRLLLQHAVVHDHIMHL